MKGYSGGIAVKNLIIYLALINDELGKHKFEQLYEQYKNLMFYTAKELLQDDHLAEDAVSTAFLQVAKSMHMIGDVHDNKTKWLLLTIVERTAINMHHKRNRDERNMKVMHDVAERNKDHHVHNTEHELTEAILKLPSDYQQVLLLKYGSGYKSKEIAAMLGYNVSKVDQMLSRGRKQLRKLLEEV
jgi:RNA polymerase sigma-70 factor (ECF subfamily)